MFGVAPSQQRLGARERIVAQAELRLIVQLQQIFLHGTAQASFDIEPIPKPSAHRRGIGDNGAGSARLRLIHGGVGVLQNGGDIEPIIGIDGDTDTRCRVELQTRVSDRVLESFVTGARDFAREPPGRRVSHQYDELIAPEPRHGNIGVLGLEATYEAGEFTGHVLQHRIADRMAERVVDSLEVIEIHVNHRHLLPRRRCIREESISGLYTALPGSGNLVNVSGTGKTLDALGRRGVAQDVSKASRQQCPVDGLGDEVGGARLEGAADGGGVLVSRHHDDRHGGEARFGAQPSAHGISVHPGHVDVEQYDRHILRQGSIERRGTVVECQGRKTGGSCSLGEEQPAEVLIVGDDGYLWCMPIAAHALAFSWHRLSSSMSAGCTAASRSHRDCASVRPPFFHLFNTVVLASATVLFYLCLRELQLPRYVSLAVPLVFALLPQYATDRFWIATYQVTLSVAFCFAGLFLGLRAPCARKGWFLFYCLGLASTGLFALSLLAYEALTGPFPLFLLLIGYHAYAKLRNRGLANGNAILRSVSLCFIGTIALGLVFAYKVHSQTRFTLPHAGALHHVRNLLWQVGTQAISFTMVKYGIELPSAAIALYRSSGAGMLAVITGGVLGISVFWYLNRIFGRPNSDHLSAKNALSMILAGLVVFAFAYTPFFVWFGADFLSIDLDNRMTIGAAIGAALVMVGGVFLLACFVRKPALRVPFSVGLLAVVCALNQICISSFGEYWVRARTQQSELISDVLRNIRPLEGTTILLDGFCPRIGPAMSFANNLDTSAAFRMALGDNDITIDIASLGAVAGTNSIVLSPGDYGPARQYAFGEKLWLDNLGRRTAYRLTDSLVADRYLETASACPEVPGEDDVVGPSWSLIPHWSGPRLGNSVSSPSGEDTRHGH